MVEKNFKYICHFCLVKLGDLGKLLKGDIGIISRKHMMN